jgi:hypothetical protein
MAGGIHGYEDNLVLEAAQATVHKADFRYHFANFFHPFVEHLIAQLNTRSLAGLFDAADHEALAEDPDNAGFFPATYGNLEENAVTFEGKTIDVSGGPYSIYNWELLFHLPLAIASHLSKNQRFQEAQGWFHFIFDPTSADRQYWRFLRFRQVAEVVPIDEQLGILSKDPQELTVAEQALKAALLESYDQIRSNPFQPHPPAQIRVFPYQYAVVMKYLDNLIAWGDSLFRQDTIESINEATQLYVLASNILGARPQRIPPRGTLRPRTFHQLRQESAQGLDAFSNALVELEGQFPFNLGTPSITNDHAPGAFGIGRALYFCIPPNEKLLRYWDLVEDRLFKVRHCMNIEGVVRQLALFDPPIDPGMLVKAAAAGISLGSILSGLNQPVGPLRAPVLIQKALDLAAELRGLGAGLLSALEKADGEQLALLRQRHEIAIQRLTQEVRFLQWKHAQEFTESLIKGRAIALERYAYYQRLLNLPVDSGAAPDTLPLDRGELTEANFDEAYAALIGQYEKAVPTRAYAQLSLKEEGKLFLHAGEYDELNVHADRAFGFRVASAAAEGITATLAAIPSVNMKAAYWGVGPDVKIAGGEILANIGRAVSAALNIAALNEDWQGQFASRTAAYDRRADEWTFQANAAARELRQMGRQILGSLIAEQIARREYLNVQAQMEQAQETEQFLRDKYTSEELYLWMQGEISRLYYEYYRLAFDTARKAEQTMKRELMRPEVDATDYVKFNYWDGGRKGLLAGEALYLDIRRMELAYHENNKREFELTKHLSLRLLSPLALLSLKATGSCEVTVPEWMFDLDCPGHYMRRIRTVGVSIPSVTGPFTSLNCTLTLLRSSVRTSPLLADGEYRRQGSEDARFVDSFGTIQSVVTSSGANDSGMFETSLRDERFLPFEGGGVESRWKLELPGSFRQFDYDTISDVILHIRYTARPGGALLGGKAIEHLERLVAEANGAGLALMFSLKHDFPTEWHQFVAANSGLPEPTVPFSAPVKRDYFPYFTQGRDLSVDAIQLVATRREGLTTATLPADVVSAFASELAASGKATFAPALTGPVKEVLVPAASVFVVLKYSLGPR